MYVLLVVSLLIMIICRTCMKKRNRNQINTERAEKRVSEKVEVARSQMTKTTKHTTNRRKDSELEMLDLDAEAVPLDSE